MTPGLTISVVIVSRERPQALRRCLRAVSQLQYDPFEVVVVTDPASCTALRSLPEAAHVKLIRFEQANISAARNAGIAAAAGEIIAFIDDDAVPEPTWLTYLSAPFSHGHVMAAGGFVRGRNGISWQSRAQSVDRSGQSAYLDVDPVRATVLTPAPDRAIRTEGTNMALRRSCLVELGGFDPRFRFFLDETDLNIRLAERGFATAIVPRAEVHHGFAASGRRRGDRVPTDLIEIGASWAVFLGKHCDAGLHNEVWKRVQREQRHRALTHMVLGGLEPPDVPRLLAGLEQGFLAGKTRKKPGSEPDITVSDDFKPYPVTRNAKAVTLSGRSWSRTRLKARAIDELASGAIVTVMRFSPTALYHRVVFRPEGYWEHTGGIFGKSERSQRLISPTSFKRRVRQETDRIQDVRGLTELSCYNPHTARKNDDSAGDSSDCSV